MATEASSENWAWVASASPRISFSHDLSQSDRNASTATAAADQPRRQDAALPLDPSASDFDFSVSAQEIAAPADELFSGGKLLPVPIKTKIPSAPLIPPSSSTAPPPAPAPPATPANPTNCSSLRDIMSTADEAGSSVRRSPSHKSFWSFRRSSSLNFGSRSRLICPFPLLRSQSTGSSGSVAPNPTTTPTTATTATPVRKPSTRNNNTSSHSRSSNDFVSSVSTPSPVVSFRKSSTSDTTARIYYYSGATRRPPTCVNGSVRVSPVLNVPALSRVSVLSHLVCKCGDKSMRKGSAVTCSP